MYKLKLKQESIFRCYDIYENRAYLLLSTFIPVFNHLESAVAGVRVDSFDPDSRSHLSLVRQKSQS